MNNLPKITLLRGVPPQDMPSTFGAAPPEMPSTWGAAPPEAYQEQVPWTDSSGATDVFKKIDASAFQNAAADCRKRPAPEGGAALPAAFKKRPQAGGNTSSPVAPAAFQQAASQRESQWAGGENSWASQQGGQAQNAMQGCGGCGGGGMGANAMNPMMAMMSMMQQGGGQNMMQQGGGQNAMQGGGGGMEAMNPMMRMMMMMQQMGGGGQNAMQGAGAGMEGMNPMMQMMMMQQQMAGAMAGQQQPQMPGGSGMDMAAMMAQAKQQAAQEAQQAQMMAMMQQQAGGEGENGSPAIDMSSWASIPDPAAEESEQAKAVREAVEATQHAQYMQQVQFLQQVSAHEAGKMKEVNAHNQQNTGLFQDSQSRFTDEYRAFKLCRFFGKGECMQGRRCVYAHCFEELHPASPDMPIEEETAEPSYALSAANAPSKKEQDNAPNMRLSKKRELCRKFMDTGNCSRGDVCPNAHGEKEIGKLAFVLYDKVKLKICMAWEKGKCSYGDKCFHAHGDNEIGMKRREFFDGPPIKRRADGQSLEDWRGEILRFPHLPSFPL